MWFSLLTNKSPETLILRKSDAFVQGTRSISKHGRVKLRNSEGDSRSAIAGTKYSLSLPLQQCVPLQAQPDTFSMQTAGGSEDGW